MVYLKRARGLRSDALGWMDDLLFLPRFEIRCNYFRLQSLEPSISRDSMETCLNSRIERKTNKTGKLMLHFMTSSKNG